VKALPARLRNISFLYWLLWVAPLGFLGVFYFYPLLNILAISFERGQGGLIAPFIEIFTTASLLKILGFTFWQAILSTGLTLLFGLPGAYLLARYRLWGKNLILAMTGVSFVLPTLVVATAFNAILGPRGWANLLLMQSFRLDQPPVHFVNTFGAILVAHVFYNTTIVLRLVGDFWAHLDPRLGQAARVLGANGWQTLRRVSLPLLMPALASASLLVFIFDFTSFGVILVLGGPRFATLEVEIYNQTISLFNLPLAAALSLHFGFDGFIYPAERAPGAPAQLAPATVHAAPAAKLARPAVGRSVHGGAAQSAHFTPGRPGDPLTYEHREPAGRFGRVGNPSDTGLLSRASCQPL
jgi:ABC-type Fe3+ transport system permease subunit